MSIVPTEPQINLEEHLNPRLPQYYTGVAEDLVPRIRSCNSVSKTQFAGRPEHIDMAYKLMTGFAQASKRNWFDMHVIPVSHSILLFKRIIIVTASPEIPYALITLMTIVKFINTNLKYQLGLPVDSPDLVTVLPLKRINQVYFGMCHQIDFERVKRELADTWDVHDQFPGICSVFMDPDTGEKLGSVTIFNNSNSITILGVRNHDDLMKLLTLLREELSPYVLSKIGPRLEAFVQLDAKNVDLYEDDEFSIMDIDMYE